MKEKGDKKARLLIEVDGDSVEFKGTNITGKEAAVVLLKVIEKLIRGKE